MLTLLGVGHVFDLERSIRDAIQRRAPKVVALELDPARFAYLMNRQPRPTRISVFAMLAQFQSRIAEQYGVQVGDEMVAAARAAREMGCELALIDQDSRITLARAWQAMPFAERVRLIVFAVSGLFVRRKRVEAELDRFYQDEHGYLEQFAKELPTVKRVLIDERDVHMADALRQLHAAKGEVVAVVGDGHVDGLGKLLQDVPLDVVRLRELQRGPPPSGNATSATVSYRL
jgi:pheromone shutdown protein TraB